MERRKFLKGAGMAGVLAAGVAPAVVSGAETVRWRLTSSFPKSLDTIHGASETLSKRVSASTGGKFKIQVFPAGEIAPGLQALDVTQNGTVDCALTCSYYYTGKDATFGLGTSIPFGMNVRQVNAWITQGDGQKLLDDFYSDYNIVSFLAGNTGVQMGGWFRKEVKTLADCKGLKIRIAGLGGKVFSELGAVPQQIAGSDIYPSLEKGTIDGAEWIGPYDDEKLGFNKVAQYYYYPGWWEPGPAIHFFVNKDKWNKLSPEYQSIFRSAADEANMTMMATYDYKNPPALERLVRTGTKIRRYSDEIIKAAFNASQDYYAQESNDNANFKKVYASYSKFQKLSNLWLGVAESRMDQFLQRNVR